MNISVRSVWKEALVVCLNIYTSGLQVSESAVRKPKDFFRKWA
jgi:hypothetical protein